MEFKLDFDTRSLSRKIDRQGFLRSKARIAKVGIQEYSEHGKVFRSASTLVKSIPTFTNQVISLSHPSNDVTAANASSVAIGFITDVRYKDGWLVGAVTITDRQAIQLVLEGEFMEFSCGYDANLLDKPGEYLGESYDKEVIDIIGNHVALVTMARAGHDATFIDSSQINNSIIYSDNIINSLDMENNNSTNSAVTQKLEDMNAEVGANASSSNAAPVETEENLESQLADALALIASLQQEIADMKGSNKVMSDSVELVDSLKAKIDILETKLADSKTTVVYDGAEISARVEVWSFVQGKLNDSVEVDYSLPVSEVRKLWLNQELPHLSAKLTDASEAYINGLWDAYNTNYKEASKLTTPEVAPVVVTEAPKSITLPLADSATNKLELARKAYIERLETNRYATM